MERGDRWRGEEKGNTIEGHLFMWESKNAKEENMQRFGKGLYSVSSDSYWDLFQGDLQKKLFTLQSFWQIIDVQYF